LPIPHHPQALELLSLYIHILECIIPAQTAKLDGTQFVAVNLHGFDDLLLNRKAMGIPARYIRGIKASHNTVSYNNIF
jgi:hypothetical protein